MDHNASSCMLALLWRGRANISFILQPHLPGTSSWVSRMAASRMATYFAENVRTWRLISLCRLQNCRTNTVHWAPSACTYEPTSNSLSWFFKHRELSSTRPTYVSHSMTAAATAPAGMLTRWMFQVLSDLIDLWVVVKIMGPFWIPIIIRHLIFRVPKKGP